MSHDKPDATDPTMLVGVSVPADAESLSEMAYAVAEEFAFMGHDAEHIVRIFACPSHRGPHAAYRGLGEAEIKRIVNECVGVYGRARVAVRDAPPRGDEE